MLRAFIFAAVLTTLTDHPIMTLLGFYYSSMMCLIATSGSPFIYRSDNIKDAVGELVILFLLYHIMCFTNFVPDPSTRTLIGTSLIITSLLFLVIMVGLYVYG